MNGKKSPDFSPKITLQEYVDKQVSEWEAANPWLAEIPPSRPPMPDAKFIPVYDGFFVLEAVSASTLRLHLSVHEHAARWIDIHDDDVSKLVDALLDMQADMSEIRSWCGLHKAAQTEYDRWQGIRGSVISEAKQEFRALSQGEVEAHP